MNIQYPYEVHQVKLSNCDIAYIDEGTGPKTILFIHGLATYALCWQKNIDGLKKNYRCIAIDLPGNGLSGRGGYVYGMHLFGETIYEFIQKLELKNVCLAGHSMGAQIAITALINHGTCAETLLLCAPAGFEQFSPLEKTMYHTSLHWADMFSSEESNLRQVIENSFYRNQQQGDGIIKDLIGIMHAHSSKEYKRMIEGCVLGMMNEPVFEKLHYILQPTLVVFGEHDALIPNKLIHPGTTKNIAEDGTNKIPAAVLKIIPNCGHFVQWEKADEVNKSILAFLETVKTV